MDYARFHHNYVPYVVIDGWSRHILNSVVTAYGKEVSTKSFSLTHYSLLCCSSRTMKIAESLFYQNQDTVVFDFQVISENIGHLQFEKKGVSFFTSELEIWFPSEVKWNAMPSMCTMCKLLSACTLSGFYDNLNVENTFQRSNGKQQARNTQQNVIRIAEAPACKESKKQIIVEKFKF
ncbi:hypothetical protein T06_10564 [Trichinella sp. T6]|nr:hypothetical protein T06_10564 [Trichinella sp. T6]